MGLYVTFTVFYMGFFAVALFLELWDLFWFKFFVAILASFLLFKYSRSRNTNLYAVLLMLIVEVDIGVTLLSGQVLGFTMIYPFMVIFGFFYFFKLKSALIATALHYGYWVLIMSAGTFLYPEDTLTFGLMPMINMFATSSMVVIFSLFYYFAN